MTNESAIPEPPADGQLDRATDPEYAAICTKAVLALAFSIVGVAALLVAPFIVLPLAGLVLGLIALRQIKRSEGVLAGRGIALAAIGAGAAVALAASAYHANNWWKEHRMFTDLKDRSYEIVDDLVAGRYAEVYAMMPEEFRRRAGTGPEQFRARMAPLLKDAGQVVRRALISLQVLQTEDGQVLAPADMRVELERRYLQFTLWFKQMPDTTWELVGVSGDQTFDSLGKFGQPSEAPAEPAGPAPEPPAQSSPAPPAPPPPPVKTP